MRLGILFATALLILAASGPIICAQVKYWDIDTVSQAGAGGATPSGTWNTGGAANWNTNPTGAGVPTTWAIGEEAVFAAGTDATGAYSIIVSGSVLTSSLRVEEGSVTQSGGTLTLAFPGTVVPINIFSGASWNESSGAVFAGNTGIIKNGLGTLILRGTNTFTKAGTGNQPFLTIADGVVDFTADANLGAVPAATDNGAALTINGGTLRFSGASALTLAANRGVSAGTNGATIDVVNANASLAFSLRGASGGKITKNGAGKLILSPSSNVYGGGLTHNAGVLGVGSDFALGTGTLVVNNSPTLSAVSGAARTLTNAVTLNGNLKFDDSFTAVPGAITWGISGANKWTITGGSRTLNVNTSAGGYQVTINQVIGQDTAGRGLTKTGNGTLALTGLNTYTGDTSVQAGTLSITNAYLANGADVYLSSGAKFALNFVGNDIIDSLFIDGSSQATGTWGAIGSGATHESALFTGSGRLQVTTLFVGVPGDFNNDGRVDAGDYVTFRKNSGTNNALANDNGLGVPVGQAHFNLWRANFGRPPGSGGGLGGADKVPEPRGIALAWLGYLIAAAGRIGIKR